MQTSIAQMVALTCYGNAAIQGRQAAFLPSHSTCQYCEWVKFIAGGRQANGTDETITVAASPAAWIEYLLKSGMQGLRLHQRAQNLAANFPDRISSAFVGGGRQWRIEGLRSDETSEFWLSKWEVGNKDAPEHKIWRVTYGLCEVGVTSAFELRTISSILDDLRTALTEIRNFSETNRCGNFTKCFDDALHALDDSEADVGYHRDLYPMGAVGTGAASLLKAAQSAWVFGGMGSWNDMGFEGETQKEYERISDKLFELLNDAIEAAATSSRVAAPRE